MLGRARLPLGAASVCGGEGVADYQNKFRIFRAPPTTVSYFVMGPFRGGSRFEMLRWWFTTLVRAGYVRFGASISGSGTAGKAELEAGEPVIERSGLDIDGWYHCDYGYAGPVTYGIREILPGVIVRSSPWFVQLGAFNTSDEYVQAAIQVVTSWPTEGVVGGLEVGGAGVKSGDVEGLAERAAPGGFE